MANLSVTNGNGTGASRWPVSAELLISSGILLTTVVATYVNLAGKVDAILSTLTTQNVRLAEVERDIHQHQLLPIHPVARIEVDHLTGRIEANERRIDKLESVFQPRIK